MGNRPPKLCHRIDDHVGLSLFRRADWLAGADKHTKQAKSPCRRQIVARVVTDHRLRGRRQSEVADGVAEEAARVCQ